VRIAGNYTFEATPEEVWSALNDPEVLARTIPGCQRLDEIGENEYETTLKIGLQAVRGVYSGRVKIDNIIAPESYDIHVDGKGSNGFLKGSGAIKLRVDGHTTILDYGGEAQIGGTIASVGQRLIDGAAKTLIHQSLKALATQIEDRRHPHAHPVESEQPPAPIPTTPDAPPPAPPAPQIERRTIVVPPNEQLSEADVARGMLEDFFRQNPWAAWVLVAFLIGYLLGRRK
jgi:uncharacterized protein